MKIKEAIKEIKNNIENTYFRIDIGFGFTSGGNGCFLIPTIELFKSSKYFGITIWIFCSYFNITLSKEHYNENESE